MLLSSGALYIITYNCDLPVYVQKLFYYFRKNLCLNNIFLITNSESYNLNVMFIISIYNIKNAWDCVNNFPLKS